MESRVQRGTWLASFVLAWASRGKLLKDRMTNTAYQGAVMYLQQRPSGLLWNFLSMGLLQHTWEKNSYGVTAIYDSYDSLHARPFRMCHKGPGLHYSTWNHQERASTERRIISHLIFDTANSKWHKPVFWVAHCISGSQRNCNTEYL